MNHIGVIFLPDEQHAIYFKDDTGLDLAENVEHLVFANSDRPESVTIEVTLNEHTQTLEAPARLILHHEHFNHI